MNAIFYDNLWDFIQDNNATIEDIDQDKDGNYVLDLEKGFVKIPIGLQSFCDTAPEIGAIIKNKSEQTKVELEVDSYLEND